MYGKFLIRFSFFLLLAFACSINLFAAKSGIKIPIQFTIENGDFKQSTVAVKKNGETLYILPGQKNSSLTLEFGNEYLLQFNKPGYISKSIRINTTVPEDRGADGFDPYKIGVRLFKQYEGVNIVVYSQPVAFIHYQSNLDEFGYDVDYTKSILSILNIAEEALAQKAAEERASLKNSGITLREDVDDVNNRTNNRSSQTIIKAPSRVTVGISAPITNSISQDVPMEHITTTNSVSGFADEKPSGMNPETGDDQLRTNQPANGNELPIVNEIIESGKDFPVNADKIISIPSMTTEKITESNRVITIFHISDGVQKIDIKKVNYNWGGVFYFKDNNASISEYLFQWYIKGK